MEKEVSEYTNTVQAIEADQRADLAVHLYSTALLHRVNPSFPHPRWASWPRYTQKRPDPSCNESFADSPIDKNAFGELPVLAKGYPEASGLEDDVMKVHFKRTTAKVRLKHKYLQQTGPKAVLLNELHAVLMERIRIKLKEKRSQADLSIEDSEFMKDMAMKLGNKLARVMQRLRQQRVRNKHICLQLKDWQDILICDLQVDKASGTPGLLRTRRLYEKCRSMFHDVSYKYEYDIDTYSSTESDDDQNRMPPVFDVKEHIQTLEDAAKNDDNGTGPGLQASLLGQLKKREALFEFKENAFIQEWDQCAKMQQLSWDRPTGSNFMPDGVEQDDKSLKKQRIKVFKDVQLKPSDFIVNANQSVEDE